MSHRRRKVAQALLRELSALLRQGKIKDPEIGFVTFTQVQMTADLKLAKIYYSVLLDDPQKVHKALLRATKYIRSQIAKELRLKYTPELSFFLDDSMQRAERIEVILKDLKEDHETI